MIEPCNLFLAFWLLVAMTALPYRKKGTANLITVLATVTFHAFALFIQRLV